MTKQMVPGSIEHALRRAMMITGDDGAEAAMREFVGLSRSASLLRKCADPDDERHHLQLRYALALDLACVDRGHAPPITEALQRIIRARHEKARNGNATEAQVGSFLLELQERLGEVAALARRTFDGSSDLRSTVPGHARVKIFERLEELILTARTLEQLLLDHASTPDGNEKRSPLVSGRS